MHSACVVDGLCKQNPVKKTPACDIEQPVPSCLVLCRAGPCCSPRQMLHPQGHLHDPEGSCTPWHAPADVPTTTRPVGSIKFSITTTGATAIGAMQPVPMCRADLCLVPYALHKVLVLLLYLLHLEGVGAIQQHHGLLALTNLTGARVGGTNTHTAEMCALVEWLELRCSCSGTTTTA